MLRFASFKGIAPRINPSKLPEGGSQEALNCFLATGALRPWNTAAAVSSTGISGTPKFIYKHPVHGWYFDPASGDMIPGPVSADQWGRTYFFSDATGPTRAPVYYTSDDYNTSYLLGVPAPDAAPVAAAAGTAVPDPPLETSIESRSYVVTYLSKYGEEGPPSPASTIINVAPGQSVNLSSLPIGPTGNYNITQKRIYRTNTGSDGATAFQLVATIAVATTTYADTVASVDLGLVLPSVEWLPPVATLHGAVELPGGIIAAFSGKDVYRCVPYMPHAWPVSSRVTMADNVVALGGYGNSLLVTTEGLPCVITGDNPERLEKGTACVSKRSFVDMGYSCIYAGPAGLVLAGAGDIKLLTEVLFTQEEWLKFCDPTTIHAYQYDGKYVAFHSTGAFVLDPDNLDLTPINVSANAGFFDKKTGELFLCSGSTTTNWHKGSGKLSYAWRSKVEILPRPISYSFAQVIADDYTSLTLEIYSKSGLALDAGKIAKLSTIYVPKGFTVAADGTLKSTHVVTSGEPFRLPAGLLSERWEIRISGTSTVTAVYLATSVEELASV